MIALSNKKNRSIEMTSEFWLGDIR